MRDILAITGALADQSRVRILFSLRDGELCVCQIVELLQLATSTISKHLSILRQAGLVDSRKDARWMYYRLADQTHTPASGALDWLWTVGDEDGPIADDAKRLRRILRETPASLCRRQSGRICRDLPSRQVANDVTWESLELSSNAHDKAKGSLPLNLETV